IRGFERFLEAGCDNCHSGPMFSDFEAHVLGVPDNPKLATSDAGLNGTYAFRTPSLRNIGLTAPYFHSGLAGDLEDVLRFYLLVRRPNNGGGPGGGMDINPNVNPNQLAPELRQLQLGPGDVDEIRAFLLALNDEDFDRDIPNRVPSGLSVGGNIGQ
ncbi:MAG: cytochrome-c peroxidase, partial [Bacteroidota bacterium]